jgi:hypothetical protein
LSGSGGERDRTDDLLLAKQALSQLSYTPDQITDIRVQISEQNLLNSDIWFPISGGPGRI